MKLTLGQFPALAAACVILLAGCGRSGGSSSGSTGSGPSVMGERLTTRTITDQQQGGLVVGVVAVPASWRFNSQVVWNYANNSNPVTIGMSAENPASAEAVFGYPPARYFYLRPQTGMFRPGQNVGGLTFAVAQPPVQVLARLIRQARATAPKLQFVGNKDLPELPAALQLPPSPNQRGLGIKVTYELGGQPMEEEFYGVFDSVDIPYDGPLGRTWQINWGFLGLHSFRAPLGTLDRRRPVFAAVAKSFRAEPGVAAAGLRDQRVPSAAVQPADPGGLRL